MDESEYAMLVTEIDLLMAEVCDEVENAAITSAYRRGGIAGAGAIAAVII
jgi:hypothetical protein